MYFDLPKEQSSIIKVIGVGGGGCNAVNHMFHQGIKDVNFVICNTDSQALDASPVANKIQLGPSLTKGRGAGSHPSVGKDATMESLQEIKEILEKNTEMVFITAGMGGGTGTGGAPVIAKTAKDLGILTIGIVTIPFGFEGRRRKNQALEGLEDLKDNVDAILIVSNDKLREIYGNLPFNEAFAKADDILTTAAKGIAEIITIPGYVNVDFEDVKTVLRKSGLAIMGSAIASGDNRAFEAVENALKSPLLNDNEISGAKSILLNISSGSKPVLMDEISEITEYVQDAAGYDCDIIWGNCNDPNLGENLMVTIIATGFETDIERTKRLKEKNLKVNFLEENKSAPKASTKVLSSKAIVDPNEMRVEKIEPPQEDSNAKQFTFEFDSIQNEFEPKKDIPEITSFFNPLVEPIAKSDENEKDDFDFIIKNNVEEEEEETQVEDEQEQIPPTAKQLPASDEINNDDKMRFVSASNDERVKRLKSMSLKLNNLDELEKVPAYLRRQVDLENTQNSSENNFSKYTVSGNENGPEFRKNNSFLHDNVD
ncbi:MAG: cell division protein FtsZ [Bacteroidetes bacterium]|nr:cell division protein FtsZ [Bacteroidota bacterium]